MTRPKSIILFERLYFTTLLIGGVRAIAQWPALVEATGVGVALATQLITFGLTLLLVMLVSRRRSSIARMLLVAGFLIGLPVAVNVVVAADFGAGGWAVIVQLLLQIAALALLFRPESRDWLASDTAAPE